MANFRIITHSIILSTTPSIFAYPQNASPMDFQLIRSERLHKNFRKKERFQLLTYDQILHLFREIESGVADEKYREKDLRRINRYIAWVAEEGILPNTENALALRNDIDDLLSDDAFEFAFATGRPGEVFLCKGKFSNAWEKTRSFLKPHKKEIIIGTVIVLAVTAVVVAVVAAPSAGAAIAAGAGGALAPTQETSPSYKTEDLDLSGAPLFESQIDNQVASFKENLATQDFFGYEGRSYEDTGRVIGALFAHDSYNQFQNRLSNDLQFAREIQNIRQRSNISIRGDHLEQGRQSLDRTFSFDYFSNFPEIGRGVNFNSFSYRMLGEQAVKNENSSLAIKDFSRAIELNPRDPAPYLKRGSSYFEMGQYDQALEDFQKFYVQVNQIPKDTPMSISQFSLGFAKGLPKGVYESGEGILLFLADFVIHPVHTSTQIVEALSTLTNLARTDEWGVVGESLAPEIFQLINEWDTLPSDERGELAGYAIGKLGGDILVPGALAKVASRSVKSAKELASVCKNIKLANEALILETAGGIGNSTKVGEIVNRGKTAINLGKDVGLTSKEMGQLHKVGKLESTINSRLDKLVSQSDSEVLKAAIRKDSHVKMVKDYLNKSAKEIQKGVNSYEKQIAIHKDKIVNPTKYYPDWDKLDLRQRQALVNKKWPAEIKGYEEQKNVLQSILNERLSYE